MQGSSHYDVILFRVSPLHVTLYLRLVNLLLILVVANQELLNVSFSLPAGLYQQNKRPKTKDQRRSLGLEKRNRTIITRGKGTFQLSAKPPKNKCWKSEINVFLK